MDPLTLMVLAGLGLVVLTHLQQKKADIAEAALETQALTQEAEIPTPPDLDPSALGQAALLAVVSIGITRVKEILADRKAGIEAFKALWPLLTPFEQHKWIQKKHQFLHATLLTKGGRSRTVRHHEESMVSQYENFTENEMLSRVEENARHVWWSPGRLTHGQVHASPLRVSDPALLDVDLTALIENLPRNEQGEPIMPIVVVPSLVAMLLGRLRR